MGRREPDAITLRGECPAQQNVGAFGENDAPGYGDIIHLSLEFAANFSQSI